VTYWVQNLGRDRATEMYRVRVEFADGTVVYGRHRDSHDDAVDAVLKRVEQHGGTAAYRARLSVS
jgi:hypothetical protein